MPKSSVTLLVILLTYPALASAVKRCATMKSCLKITMAAVSNRPNCYSTVIIMGPHNYTSYATVSASLVINDHTLHRQIKNLKVSLGPIDSDISAMKIIVSPAMLAVPG